MSGPWWAAVVLGVLAAAMTVQWRVERNERLRHIHATQTWIEAHR